MRPVVTVALAVVAIGMLAIDRSLDAVAFSVLAVAAAQLEGVK